MSTGHVTSAVAVHREEAILFFTLLQLTIVVLAGRVGAALAVRVGQTTVVGEIIVGILLGPSLFGLLAPDTFHFVFRSAPPDPMQVLSQLGLLLLMFQIGLTFDFGHLTERRNRNTVLWVAAVGLVLPFVMGLALGWVMAPYLGGPAGNPLAMALFVATAFSITALPVMGRILMECNMAHRPLGVMAISAAAINDVVGWLLLALVTALSVAQFQATGFALNVLAVLVFIVASWWLIRPPLKRVVRWTQARPDRDGVTSPLPNDLLGILIAAVLHGPRGLGGLLIGSRERAAMSRADGLAAKLGAIPKWGQNKWYIDELYNAIVRVPLLVLGHLFHLVDKLLVDGIVDGLGKVPRLMGESVRPSQSGVMHGYAAAMVGGIAVLIIIVLAVTA